MTIIPGRVRLRWAGMLVAPIALASAAWTGAASAQQLEIEEQPPPAPQILCESVSSVARDSVADEPNPEVARLTNAATQAMLLGDQDGALEFLNRAVRVDSTAAEALYLRSRIRLERGQAEGAAGDLCQYLRLDPSGGSAPEAISRLEEAADQGVGEDFYTAFATGTRMYDEGQLEAAERAFSTVVDARPQAAAAVYNRGLVRALLERPGPARADLERYLALEPGAANADAVRRYLAILAADDGPGPNRALIAGTLIPGAGQFYTRRPLMGTLVFGAAAGAVTAGYLAERTTIRCRVANPEGACPPDQIASTATARPYLPLAIGVAAGVAIGAAIEASLYASRQQSERYDPPVVSALRSGIERVVPHRGGVRYTMIEYSF